MNTGDISAGIRAASNRVRDLTAELDTARARRNELIASAVDHEGMTTVEVARYAGVSQPQVCRILSSVSANE